MSRHGRQTMKDLIRGRAAALVAILAAALAVAGCGDLATPPQFEIEGVGSVEGRLFLDQMKTGFYDPAAGDVPLPGVRVALFDRGTDRVLAGPVTTDQQGRFAFTDVRPGTHDLFVISSETEPLPHDAVVCRNPMPVSVYRGEPRGMDVAAFDACLITIAEARELGPGEFVNIRGVVTSFPGQVQSSYVYIQDATAGIQFFTSALNDAGLEIGDLIDVSGVLDEFNNTLQLIDVQLNEVVPDVGVPAPAATTTGQIATDATNFTGTFQGRLVRVTGAQLVTGFTTGGSRNAQIDDGTGTALVRVASGVVSGNGNAILVALGLEVGKCYNITGLVGAFGSDGQLFPRSGDDFVEVPCS
jgi:hypothetical protein